VRGNISYAHHSTQSANTEQLKRMWLSRGRVLLWLEAGPLKS
jgi:hypothetical protein